MSAQAEEWGCCPASLELHELRRALGPSVGGELHAASFRMTARACKEAGVAHITPVFLVPGLQPADVVALEVRLIHVAGTVAGDSQWAASPDARQATAAQPVRLVGLGDRMVSVEVTVLATRAPDVELECRFRVVARLAAEVAREVAERPRSLQLLAMMAQPAMKHAVSQVMAALVGDQHVRVGPERRRWAPRVLRGLSRGVR